MTHSSCHSFQTLASADLPLMSSILVSGAGCLLSHRLTHACPVVRQFYSLSRSHGLLLVIRSARPPSRSLVRLVEFAQRKWRDIYYEPLRILYRKDKVSRARNILVYKSQRNLAVPVFGALWAICLCIGLEFSYRIFYLEEHKKRPEYDKHDINLEVYLPIVGLIGWTICSYRLMTRHVARVYYNEAKKEFTIITHNLVAPFSTMRRVVRAGTGRLEKYPDNEFIYSPSGLFPRVTYNCSVEGQKYLMHPEFFKYPVYFNVLFGFDDPEAIAKLDDSDRTADQVFRQRESDGRIF